MIKYLICFFYLIIFSNAQNISVRDKDTNNKLSGVQMFYNSGSLLEISNEKGEFSLTKNDLEKLQIKNVSFYKDEYSVFDYDLSKNLNFIELEKNKFIDLQPVTIKINSTNNFVLKGYFRSKKIINNKLVKYSDGLIEYHISKDTINSKIDKYITQFRTLKVDSIKEKSSFISVSMNDSYLNISIHRNDIIKRYKFDKIDKINDTLSFLYKTQKNGNLSLCGYAIFDKFKNAKEIRRYTSFEGENTEKILFWKVSGKFESYEKWIGKGVTRHPSYIFSSKKALVESKNKDIFNAEETINEIFLDKEIIYTDKKPQNYKTIIDRNISFYNIEYWKESLKKYPINNALLYEIENLSENKNKYK